MEKLLGVLFCGGKGNRLGEITQYISKSFVPIYDRPVFQYGLQLLKDSKFVDDIIILTNYENDKKLQQTGFQTIIQDDVVVFDMFTGWEFIKKKLDIKKDAILMPSDNISNVNIDALVQQHYKNRAELSFSLIKVDNGEKLKEMGVYDIENQQFYYKSPNPVSNYGVIAPYVVSNVLDTSNGDNVLGHNKVAYLIHNGFWFDIGDYESIIESTNYIRSIINV